MAETGVPEQPKINWGRLLVTLLVGGVLTAICFVLDWWWVGTVCMLLTLFAACFSFSPVLHPIAFTVFAMFAIGWLAGGLLEGVLHKGEASAWWRDALIILGGFGIGVAIPAFFWFMTFFVSTKWVLGLPGSHEVKWWDAFTFVSMRAFGLAVPTVRVENGKLVEPLHTQGLLKGFVDPKSMKAFGGPGVLVVGEGNAVVLERAGKLSRVLGEGTYKLKRGEWFKRPEDTKGIHDLRGGGGPPMVVDEVMTRDGVPLDINVLARCHLERKAETDDRPASRYADAESSSPVIGENSQYPIYEATIRKAVYRTGDNGWKTAFPLRAVPQLRNAVAKYDFDEIMGMSGAGQTLAPGREVVQQIEKDVKAAVGQGPLSQGVVLDFVAILGIEVPEKTRKAMEDRWAEPIRSRILLQEAEISRRKKIAESEGEAASIIAVETARHNASDAWEKLLRRLQEWLPRVEEDPEVALRFATLVQDLLLRVGEGDIRELRRLMNTLQGDQPFGMPMGGYGGAPGTYLGPLSVQPSQRPVLSDGTDVAPETQQKEPES